MAILQARSSWHWEDATYSLYKITGKGQFHHEYDRGWKDSYFNDFHSVSTVQQLLLHRVYCLCHQLKMFVTLGASGETVACTTWPIWAKWLWNGFESHCSHIGLLFFPSCISFITKVSLHIFLLGFFRSFPLYAEYDTYILDGKYIQETLLLLIYLQICHTCRKPKKRTSI